MPDPTAAAEERTQTIAAALAWASAVVDLHDLDNTRVSVDPGLNSGGVHLVMQGATEAALRAIADQVGVKVEHIGAFRDPARGWLHGYEVTATWLGFHITASAMVYQDGVG